MNKLHTFLVSHSHTATVEDAKPRVKEERSVSKGSALSTRSRSAHTFFKSFLQRGATDPATGYYASEKEVDEDDLYIPPRYDSQLPRLSKSSAVDSAVDFSEDSKWAGKEALAFETSHIVRHEKGVAGPSQRPVTLDELHQLRTTCLEAQVDVRCRLAALKEKAARLAVRQLILRYRMLASAS
ncbi:hypothetical protein BC830DRAFT_1173358 [Chytriomyces sp. MP71]|nr:hypothetical protein BC830DRAFT_1173358 [Chytriomyces sp. MP71]